jgi:hypothetical protein
MKLKRDRIARWRESRRARAQRRREARMNPAKSGLMDRLDAEARAANDDRRGQWFSGGM